MATSTQIPESWLLPLFWAVTDGSQAGGLSEEQPALLVGQAFVNSAATAAPKTGGNTGNGTIAMDASTPAQVGAATGVYKAKFTSPTAFAVTSPSNAAVGAGIVGAPFSNQVKFTITAGATAFIVNDEFDITVSAVPIGTATPNVPIPVGTQADAQRLFGVGSMLERMVTRFLSINTEQQLWAAPVQDPAAGVAAAGSVLFGSPPTTSGVLFYYIAGQLVQVTVYSTDTPATIAANLVAAVNAMTTLPVTAAVDGSIASKVDFTCKWLGLTGNDIQMSVNYLGLYGGQVLPAGLTYSIAPMSGGVGNPNFTNIIANIAAIQFYHVGMPYPDTGSMQTWDAEFGFTQTTGRWSFQRAQYGWVYNAYRNDYSDAMAFGETLNSAVISTGIIEPTAPSPIWEWTAAYCALGGYYLLDDPARPLQTLPLTGILPALPHDRFPPTELNNLAGAGFAIFGVNGSGVPAILRECLQYQLNAYGQEDTAFNLLTVLSNLAELLTRFKNAITTKYPRHKLAPDGTAFGAGQAIVTPKLLEGEIVAEAVQAIYDGLMSNLAAFKQNLVVEIDDTNLNRVNVLWPPYLMGQMRQFAVLAQFRKLYNPNLQSN